MSTIRFALSISKPSTGILQTSFSVNHQIRFVHFKTINWNPSNFIQCQPSDLLGPFRNHQLESFELHSIGNHSIRLVHIKIINFTVLQTSFKYQWFNRFIYVKNIKLNTLNVNHLIALSISRPPTWRFFEIHSSVCYSIASLSIYWNHQLESFKLNSIFSSQSFLEGFGLPLYHLLLLTSCFPGDVGWLTCKIIPP